jgi:hypothetical protein
MRDLTDRQEENFAIITRTDVALEKLAIFVHGFRGNYWTTWGPLPNLLQTEADNQAIFEEWDYLFLGYDTGSIATYLDIAQFIWTHWRDASAGNSPYPRPYTELALIGHSLGTLGIRQALCAHVQQPASMLPALYSVTYFGSPVNGSPLAKFPLPDKILEALAPLSPQLRMLKGWTSDGSSYKPWPQVQLITGTDDNVVGYAIAEFTSWAGDGPISVTNTDHTGLVKPKGWNTRIIDFLKTALK